MDGADRILKAIQSPEGKEIVKKWLDEYLIKENIKNIKIQKILSNTDYMRWLEIFTIEHLSFFDNDWLYVPERISKKDYEQVDNLHLLYFGIKKYASENNLNPTYCYDDWGNFYKIKFGNVGFEIGLLLGQGNQFFCNRVGIENEKDFIDFNDISKNKKIANESDSRIDLVQPKILKKK